MRVLWALEELELTYELVDIPFPPRVKCPTYLDRINPLGTVPTIFVDDMKMIESVAICMWLAEMADSELCIGKNDKEYGAYLDWCMFGEATLTIALALVRRYGELEGEERKQLQVVEDYKKWFVSRSKILRPILMNQSYICRYGFTVADISIGYALMAATETWWNTRVPDEIQSYVARLVNRPAYMRSKTRELEAMRLHHSGSGCG